MKKIHFEDHGQDFLTWTISDSGRVKESFPFQSWVWCKCTVVLESIKLGKCLRYRSDNSPDEEMIIRYPIECIEEFPENTNEQPTIRKNL